MDFSFILYAVLFYIIFKLGEHYAYLRIARGLTQLKNHVAQTQGAVATPIHSTTLIEKIGDQYYTYIDDSFIGQGSSIEDATNLVQETIIKNPNKFGIMKIVFKE